MISSKDSWGELLVHNKQELFFGDVKIIVEDGVFTPDPSLSYSASVIIQNLPLLNGLRVADVGTGTGIIAIFAAKQGAREVVATDVSGVAIENAQVNVIANNVVDRVKILKTNLLDDVQGKFDLICANLPILDELWETQGVKTEATIEVFLKEAKMSLNLGGQIYLSWGSFAEKKDIIEDLFKKHGYDFRSVTTEQLGHVWYLYILYRTS
ncbi:MAG: methyltransferase [bacterium]|nr:methyltransferase [bacterium]